MTKTSRVFKKAVQQDRSKRRTKVADFFNILSEEVEVVEQHKHRKQNVHNKPRKHDGIEYSFAFVH